MTDETGKNDETKPAAEAAPQPSRRQIALLGAAAPILLTLPIKGARATGGGGYDPDAKDTEKWYGTCNASSFSMDYSHKQDKITKEAKWKDTPHKDKRWNKDKKYWEKHQTEYDYKYQFNYSCFEPKAKEYKQYKVRNATDKTRWVKA